ncbi:MAG: uroporphyrinogen-III synthase [Ignavibacteriaceae bacterium]|nr:uroporphyrinogen-III synthase [Ignavibacteriaceae bacterium]
MIGILTKMKDALIIPEAKKENSKQVKIKKIIESASILFSRKSYHEVMMEEVAKLASIAKGTVYNYFSSKEELYFSIMKGRMEKLILSLRDYIELPLNSIDSLRSFVLHLYMFMMKHHNFFMMYRKESLNAEHALCTDLINLEKDLRGILKQIIKSGKNDGIFRNLDEEFCVDLILGSIYGAVHRGIENDLAEEQMISERQGIYDFIMHGLFSGFQNDDALPLKNKTIVITRAIETSKESAELFCRLGADVITFPTLDIVPPDSWNQFDEFILKKNKIDFIIFTSAHAVKMFSKRLEELHQSINYASIKVVAVGNKTSSVCEKYGIPINIIPKNFSSDGVISELLKFKLHKKVIFIPRSAIGREELPGGLEELGAVIKSIPVYNVAIPSAESLAPHLSNLKKSRPDLYIFTSPSTFENFVQILKINDPVQYFMGFLIAAIGPTTRTAIENRKLKVNIIPDEYTIEGLAKAVVNHYKMK